MTLSLAPAKHKASCLRSLPGASIRTVSSPNIVIHWRFSENECQVPRLEVSPRTRKRGVRGRVVEIGALNHRCVHQDALYELLLDSLPKRGQRPSRRTKKPRFTRPRTVQKRATNGRGFRQ